MGFSFVCLTLMYFVFVSIPHLRRKNQREVVPPRDFQSVTSPEVSFPVRGPVSRGHIVGGTEIEPTDRSSVES